MDYSVGSLSDLITGKNTPNKKKVVTKKVHLKNEVSIINESIDDIKEQNIADTDHLNQNVKKLKTKKRKLSDNNEDEPTPNGENVKKVKTKKQKLNENNEDESTPNEGENVKKVKTKKQKLNENNEDEPTPKRSANSINAEKRVAFKEQLKLKKKIDDPEKLSRTVFVGNVPLTCDTKQIKKLFLKYGKIESVRIRGMPVANPKTPKKVALIKKEFHPERKSFNSYIRFKNREDAIKAEEANGLLYMDHHLRVHLCGGAQPADESKAIFVGNLGFFAEEEDLWKLFESCGPIASVRIVRDKKTKLGIGIGYVNFQNSDSVTLALEMENVKLKNRELRISISNVAGAKKTGKKKLQAKKPRKPRGFKKPIKNEGDKDAGEEDEKKKKPFQRFANKGYKKNTMKKPFQGASGEENNKNITKKPFQGVAFSEKKKKNKLNRGLMQKKRIIKKIAPKQ